MWDSDSRPASPRRASRFDLSRAALRPPLKRAMDLAGAALLLLLVAPTFLLVLLLVGLDGAPVLAAERRVGRDGREFGLLAFRTARPGPGEAPQPTRLGLVLHRTCLDLLPRLLNVLRGDLSLVGPRPVTRAELDGPYALFGGRAAYLSVRPGLVGPYQGDGPVGLGSARRAARDTDYARHPSLRTDFGILACSLGFAPRPSCRSRQWSDRR